MSGVRQNEIRDILRSSNGTRPTFRFKLIFPLISHTHRATEGIIYKITEFLIRIRSISILIGFLFFFHPRRNDFLLRRRMRDLEQDLHVLAQSRRRSIDHRRFRKSSMLVCELRACARNSRVESMIPTVRSRDQIELLRSLAAPHNNLSSDASDGCVSFSDKLVFCGIEERVRNSPSVMRGPRY